ncbi:MAG: hypothetical protein AAGG75_14990 [Bacteroidota bacterium]
MRPALLFLFLLFGTSTALQGQSIDFQILAVDTTEHFVNNPYYGSHFDENYVISNEEAYKELFYKYRKIDLPRPRFSEHSILKRTIRATCLLGLDSELRLDSLTQKLTWQSTLQVGNCGKETVRHMILLVPKIPDHYEVLFQETKIKAPNTSDQTATDWIDVTQTYQHPNFICPDNEKRRFLKSGLIIDNDSTFAHWQGKGLNCGPLDWDQYYLLNSSHGGDCLMQLYHQLWYDPVTQHLILTVYNVWGGCRAGGFRNLLLALKKSEEDLPLLIQEMDIDQYSDRQLMDTFLKKATDKKK